MRTAPLDPELKKKISMYCMKKENVLKYFIRPLDQLAVEGKVSFTLVFRAICHRTC